MKKLIASAVFALSACASQEAPQPAAKYITIACEGADGSRTLTVQHGGDLKQAEKAAYDQNVYLKRLSRNAVCKAS